MKQRSSKGHLISSHLMMQHGSKLWRGDGDERKRLGEEEKKEKKIKEGIQEHELWGHHQPNKGKWRRNVWYVPWPAPTLDSPWWLKLIRAIRAHGDGVMERRGSSCLNLEQQQTERGSDT
jgi:hypothetical protein